MEPTVSLAVVLGGATLALALPLSEECAELRGRLNNDIQRSMSVGANFNPTTATEHQISVMNVAIDRSVGRAKQTKELFITTCGRSAFDDFIQNLERDN